jgi:hypothetical protein
VFNRKYFKDIPWNEQKLWDSVEPSILRKMSFSPRPKVRKTQNCDMIKRQSNRFNSGTMRVEVF